MRLCTGCARVYPYDVPTCAVCGSDLVERSAESAVVLAVTRVDAPSIGHEEVPYWTALARTDLGDEVLVKLDAPVAVGERLGLGRTETGPLAVAGVLGGGVMGRGLVELLLSRGHEVIWFGRSIERLEAARGRVLDRLLRVMNEADVDAAAERLTLADDPAALAPSDIVIEAVAEELPAKIEVLRAVEPHLRPDAVVATNTSGLSLEDLAAALAHPERFGGLHFFNPPNRMRLVETAVPSATNDATSAFLDAFAVSLGKVPVRVAAKPAFVVNRVLMPLLNEAVRTLEEGVAPAESIDEAIRLGLNHPMGPLALADLIGLDVVIEIMDNLAERTGDETYEPRPMLRELVAHGRLGRKTGAGFYEYGA